MESIYSIVIPVYNSEKTLAELYQRLVLVMNAIDIHFELIFVEDCGKDRSWDVLQNIARQDMRVSAIQLQRNVGQRSATLAGISQAHGAYIITLDDDLQHPPEEIPLLITTLQNNKDIDVVIGIPKIKKHPLFRRLGSELFNKITNYCFNLPPSFRITAFRAMKKQIAHGLLTTASPNTSIGMMLLNITRRISCVVVDHHARKAGKSGYSMVALIQLGLSHIIGYTLKPLHIIAFVSITISLYILTQYLMSIVFLPHWTAVSITSIALSSVCFLTYSRLNKYLSTIRARTRAQDTWSIRHLVKKNDSF